jgi:hypothetical protein
MPEPKEPTQPDPAQIAWKSEEEQHGSMEIKLTPDQLCAMAQSREKLNARVMAAIVTVTLALAAAMLYNVFRVDQPWIRLGQAWTLGVIVYLFAPALERRPRIGASEPCAQFLERQHGERRRGYLRIRHRLFLLIPGIVACWWGNPLAATRPWLFVMTGIALVLVWFAFGKAAEKASRDREELLRRISQ